MPRNYWSCRSFNPYLDDFTRNTRTKMYESTVGLNCMHNLPVPIRQALNLKSVTSTIEPEVNDCNQWLPSEIGGNSRHQLEPYGVPRLTPACSNGERRQGKILSFVVRDRFK
jgi:hypothetical protein